MNGQSYLIEVRGLKRPMYENNLRFMSSYLIEVRGLKQIIYDGSNFLIMSYLIEVRGLKHLKRFIETFTMRRIL